MAKIQPLKLSDLRSGEDYPVMGTQEQERRCLFHVKLTDFSMRSIESLINSEKGAFFSLWFGDGGGTISIPGSKEDRKFNFKTSQGDIDGLECVHQAVDASRQPQLNCWGQIRYKLQVQGTKEVYERTKKLMKETEEQKQKNRTQTINFPHTKGGRSKSGGHLLGRSGSGRPLVKTSTPFSSPSISTSSSSSSATLPTSGATTSSSTVTAGSFSSKFSSTGSSNTSTSNNTTSSINVNTTPSSNTTNSSVNSSKTPSSSSGGGRKSSKPPHTLKERIIHLLAVKPQKRTDIINRLKKETKRGETAMSKTDLLLQEVADIQGEMYCLKQSLYCELRVDDWPFYSDAERQLVKRKHSGGDQLNEYMKRPAAPTRDPPPSKRQKLAHSHNSTPPPPHHITQPTNKPSPPPPPSSKSSNSSSSQLNMPLLGMDRSNLTNPQSNIEMQSITASTNNLYTSSSAAAGHSTSVSNTTTTKPRAQYPGSILSNFIRANSSLHPSSSMATGPMSTPQASSRSASTSAASQSQTSLTGLQTSLTTSQPTGGGNEVVTGAEFGLGGGKVFGDLVAVSDGGGTKTSEQAMEVVEKTSSVVSKKKKKKKSKTKERVEAELSKSVPSEDVKPSVDKLGGENRVKTEIGAGGDVKCDVRSGDGGDMKNGKVKNETSVEDNGASSTTPSSVDLALRYPPITSDTTRAEYKKIFNDEYQEYLTLKGQIEIVTNEVTDLSNQMATVKKGTEEAKVLKRKIREKYTDLQQNKKYQSQKGRFQELHSKLGHIKKLVVAYDQSH